MEESHPFWSGRCRQFGHSRARTCLGVALAGIDATCRYEFDNTFAYQATEEISIESSRVANLLKLYEAGLIDKELARSKAGGLI